VIQKRAEQLELATQLDKLGRAVRSLVDSHQPRPDQHQKRALDQLQQHLRDMAEECRSGTMRRTEQRYGYVARLVVEMDPAILAPQLGGELIEAERKYQDL